MSNRSHSLNAYEVALTSAVGDASLSFPVETVAGLSVPMYAVVDPDDPVNREYIKITSINGNNLDVGSLANRGLLGTTGGVPLAHDLGAKVRAVAVSQWLDDIFGDIEQLEIWDSDHESDVNAHPGYVKVAGDTMTGFLSLNADPTSALHAATKQYVDAIPIPSLETIIFSFPGEIEVKTGVGRFIAQYDGTILGTQASLGVAPTGADAVPDINTDGTTIFSDQGLRPSIADGDQDSLQTEPDAATLAKGAVVTIDIDEIGTTTPGEFMTVMMLVEAT